MSPDNAAKNAGADQVHDDPVEVFQSAFWRRPGEQDEILHAERRHWLDEGEVSKWQWFLEVRPSQELVHYLRDRNAFSLSPLEAGRFVAHAPQWFRYPSEGATAFGVSSGEMYLVFCADGRLFATGQGAGFQQAFE
ncbi:MAG: hypothetical protein AAF191_13695 [Verrucomicrobiota bacterium]